VQSTFTKAIHNRKRLLAALEGMETNIKWLKENCEPLAERRFQNLIQVRQKMGTPRKQDRAGTAKPEAVPPGKRMSKMED
jgi:hypothetical protein